MRIISSKNTGELRSDAYDGQGDPAFYGSAAHSVVVEIAPGDDDQAIEDYVTRELNVVCSQIVERTYRQALVTALDF